MANQGAKKRKEENTRHMKNLLRLIIACNVIYLLVRVGIFHSTFKWGHWAGLILTSLAYIIPYQQLDRMSKPAYAENGELLDGGFDMSTGGVCGYLHDVIYVTCFVQLTSIISEKFWYIYLVTNILSLAFQDYSGEIINRNSMVEPWTVVMIQDRPKQYNSHDCGIYVFKYMDYIARSEVLEYTSWTKKDALMFRYRIAWELKKNEARRLHYHYPK